MDSELISSPTPGVILCLAVRFHLSRSYLNHYCVRHFRGQGCALEFAFIFTTVNDLILSASDLLHLPPPLPPLFHA